MRLDGRLLAAACLSRANIHDQRDRTMSNYQNTTRAERVVLVTACNNPSVYERFTA